MSSGTPDTVELPIRLNFETFVCAWCAQVIGLATAKAKAAFALTKLKRDALPASDARIQTAAGFNKFQENRDLDCLSNLCEAIKRAGGNKTAVHPRRHGM